VITEDEFREALHDRVGPALAQMQPSGDLLDSLRARQSRHTRLLLAGVSGAVVVIAAGAAVIGQRAFGRSTTTPVSGVTPSAVATPGTSREQITRDAMQAMLAKVSLPPGSHVVTAAPAPELTAPATTQMSTNLVDVSGWWTIPGTVQDTLTYIKAHPPTGTTAIGTASGDASGNGESVTFDTTATSDYADPQLMITVSADAGGAAVRVDAQAIWRPKRSAAETLDAATVTAGSVENTGFGGRSPSGSSVSLTKAQVRQVVALLNGLYTAAPVVYHCPPATTRTLTFDTATGPVQFDPTNCVNVNVTAAGAQQPALQNSPALENWINALFGAVQSAPPSTPSSNAPNDSAAMQQYQAKVGPVANLLIDAGKQDPDFGAIVYDFPHQALDVYRKSGTPDPRYTQIADQYGVTVIFHKSLMTATETSATIAALVAAEPQFAAAGITVSGVFTDTIGPVTVGVTAITPQALPIAQSHAPYGPNTVQVRIQSLAVVDPLGKGG
jgi:hypothetical protein